MKKVNILEAVSRLSSTLNKIEGFDPSEVDLSARVLDNRIITLEGYLRFLEREGIPKIKKIWSNLNQDYNVESVAGDIDD